MFTFLMICINPCTFQTFRHRQARTILIFSIPPSLPVSDRFEIEIEPLFASIALYDVKERKKVCLKKQQPIL
jgi:hypothetical protein